MNKIVLTVFLANVLAAPLLSASENFGLERTGLRVGIDMESSADITSYEIYSVIGTPWQWNFRHARELLLELELAGGVLDGEDETGGLFKIAPQLRFQSTDFPVDVVISSGPAYVSEEKFGDLNLGGEFQFMSTLGIDWKLNDRWTIGYRFEHTSNAGIHDENDGLNMHAIGVGYIF